MRADSNASWMTQKDRRIVVHVSGGILHICDATDYNEQLLCPTPMGKTHQYYPGKLLFGGYG